MNSIGHCVTIVIETEHHGKCTTTVNGAELTFNDNRRFESNGVSVIMSSSDHIAISVPNCAMNNVIMIASCKSVGLTGSAFVEFQVQDGIGIRPSAHGLIGEYKFGFVTT